MRLLTSFAVVVCLFAFGIHAETVQPEDVKSIAKDPRSNDWYLAQAELWKKHVDGNPRDDRAWRNYYFAVRYANFTKEGPLTFGKDKKAALAEIVEKMRKAVPLSCNTYFVRLFDVPLEQADLKLVREANRACPESMELLEQSVFLYEVCGAGEDMKNACRKIYQAGRVENEWLDYNYNLLVSADSNAILFTNGDNDTYPAWILQKALGIREDVLILNRYMVFKKKSYLLDKLKEKKINIQPEALPSTQDPTEFLAKLSALIKKQNPDIPVYFAITINDMKSLDSNLYNVGLVSAYSASPVDNIALLRRNFETRYRLDYLSFDWQENKKAPASRSFDANYIYPLLILMRHHKVVGEIEKVAYWRDLTERIMRRTGNEKALPMLKEFE